MIPISSVYGIRWPALPAQAASTMLAVQFQLEQSQWWTPEALLRHQFSQLERVLVFAAETIPFYAARLKAAGVDLKPGLSRKAFENIPILTRSEIQSYGEALLSPSVPKDHGRTVVYRTSGSTGRPIKSFGTELTQFFWNALTLRDHLWHKRDLTGKLASIRTTVKDGSAKGWGPATDIVFGAGSSAMLNIRADTGTQAEWLAKENPDYLLSHPSNILALAKRSIEMGIRVPGLKQVRTFGETLGPDLRAACAQAWGVPVVDAYSSEEIGYMALQCPQSERYHIQSENVFVEVLDGNNRPCAPGETGRVVITTLHNFAMPLIRYEILDYAEAGDKCPCGRGLPVVNRVLGRQRNMVTLPDGKQHWPSFPAESWASIAPIRQIQLVQRELDLIVVRVVTDSPLGDAQESRLREALQERLGYPFRITLEYRESIERGANFKYEDFVSELSGAPQEPPP